MKEKIVRIWITQSSISAVLCESWLLIDWYGFEKVCWPFATKKMLHVCMISDPFNQIRQYKIQSLPNFEKP